MSTYYDKVFLDRAEEMMRYDVGAQQRDIPQSEGKSIEWNRFSSLSKATSALSEATNPSFTDMTTNTVSATVQPYGNATKAGELYDLTSIEQGLREHVEVHGQNAGETLDELIKTELEGNGTDQFVGGTALSDVASSDTLDGAAVRTAVTTLKENKARQFEDGRFRSVVPVSGTYDLRADSEWLDAYRYTDAENIRNGEIGELHGVRFFETNNQSSESSSPTVYHTFVFGRNAYGTVNIEGQPERRIHVKQPDSSSTNDPLDMFSTVGWKAHFATKVLNSNWLVEVHHASGK